MGRETRQGAVILDRSASVFAGAADGEDRSGAPDRQD
jgi:hypothetical protein